MTKGEKNMAIAPKSTEKKLETMINVWETLRPTKSFAGLTLDEFKAKVKNSFDARNVITSLDSQMTAALTQREEADEESLKIAALIVNAIKGDPSEGEDGELYEALGYVRKSDRQSGLTRKGLGNVVPPPQP